jgi:hypothetical protein
LGYRVQAPHSRTISVWFLTLVRAPPQCHRSAQALALHEVASRTPWKASPFLCSTTSEAAGVDHAVGTSNGQRRDPKPLNPDPSSTPLTPDPHGSLPTRICPPLALYMYVHTLSSPSPSFRRPRGHDLLARVTAPPRPPHVHHTRAHTLLTVSSPPPAHDHVTPICVSALPRSQALSRRRSYTRTHTHGLTLLSRSLCRSARLCTSHTRMCTGLLSLSHTHARPLSLPAPARSAPPSPCYRLPVRF